MDNVAMIVEMRFQHGQGEAWMDRLGSLVALAAEETGTLAYALHVDAKDGDHVWFYELYADADGYRAHARQPELQEALAAMAPSFAAPPVVHKLAPVRAAGALRPALFG